MKSLLIIFLLIPFLGYGQLDIGEKRDILELQIQQHYSNAFTRPAENTVNWQETKSYLDTAIIPCISNSIGFRYSFYLSSQFYFRTGVIYGRKTYMRSPKNRSNIENNIPQGYAFFEIPPKKIRIPIEINFAKWVLKKKLQVIICSGLELQTREDLLKTSTGSLAEFYKRNPSTLENESKGIFGFRYRAIYDTNMKIAPDRREIQQNLHLLNLTCGLGFKYHPTRQFEVSMEYQFSIGESFRNVNEGKYENYSHLNRTFKYKTKGYAQSIQFGFGIYI
jgi:hypothetical protein